MNCMAQNKPTGHLNFCLQGSHHKLSSEFTKRQAQRRMSVALAGTQMLHTGLKPLPDQSVAFMNAVLSLRMFHRSIDLSEDVRDIKQKMTPKRQSQSYPRFSPCCGFSPAPSICLHTANTVSSSPSAVFWFPFSSSKNLRDKRIH